MKKISIILSLALMPVFAACGNANSKTSETSAAGNENVIRTTSDKIIVYERSGTGDDEWKASDVWSYQETSEGCIFTCKGDHGEKSFALAEKYNLSQFDAETLNVEEKTAEKIIPFQEYQMFFGQFMLARPSRGIAIETNGHILLLLAEQPGKERSFSDYQITNTNFMVKTKSGKELRFVEYKFVLKNWEKGETVQGEWKELLPLYTPTNSPAKSSTDNVNEVVKGEYVRVF